MVPLHRYRPGAGERMRGRKAIVSIPVGRVPWGIVVDE